MALPHQGGPKTSYEAYLEDHLHRMHHDIEVTTRKLELEKRRLNKLDEDVTRTRNEYYDKVMPKKHTKEKEGDKAEKYKAALEDKSGAGTNKSETPAQLVIAVKKAENRLSKTIQKLNTHNHECTELRDRIDQIRRERIQFNQVFKRLHEDIRDNTRQLKEIQEETNAAREVSEEARRRVGAMQKKLDLERKEFKEGVERLELQMKDVEREKKELEVRLHKGESGDTKKGFLVADEENAFSESGFMKRILKLAFLNTIQRRHIKQHQKNIEVFEQAFATIKSTTGISDIEEIVKIFVKLEERNFSLLTYVNQLNREIETLEKRNTELGEQIQNQKRLEADGELRRRSVLQDLKTQITTTKAASDENSRSYESQTEIIEKCRPIVISVSRVVEKENRGFVGGPPNSSELNYDNLLEWLAFIERTLTQWRDFIPETKDTRQFKPFPYTVGNQVKALPPKRPQAMWAPPPLIRAADLPSAMLTQEQTAAAPRVNITNKGDDGSESDEEDYGDHPWTRAELKDKTLASLTKRRKNRKAQGEALDAGRTEEKAGLGDATGGERDGGKELSFNNDMADKKGDGSDDDDESDGDLEGPTDDEINEIFLRRYKMTKEELQAMADKMGIALNNLCYLKQEFDTYDEDRSGYIDVKELKELLEKLGEELTEEELEQAFKELDTDNSGEIEFFEFVEWFTCDD